MKIGPAHADKTGGMKLARVNRTESLREDREVAEALSTWKKQLGGLRAAITMANAEIRGTVFSEADISDNLHIRGAQMEEGAMTAPKCCFVCGLKREERLEKIDVDVEDSFGEWLIIGATSIAGCSGRSTKILSSCRGDIRKLHSLSCYRQLSQTT